ncbi:fumarylacetoacetate hydrolase family protein [Paenibacillus periandrae]|uniref:fumarylacetoacetate hydrolase family protein n=1 Tax=Paenibacillus periandrae TaxID=1761741 RepID=UPI001F092056|nr:fumarylacetoacetate hydrolase family protein [Paenibacillus periandrae]
MKFVTFINQAGKTRAGWIKGEGIVDLNLASEGKLPASMIELLNQSESSLSIVEHLNHEVSPTYALDEVQLIAPLPRPNSFRDFVGFEQHLKNAKRFFNEPIPKEWYEVPVFYFSNPFTMKGPDQPVKRPAGCVRLDYELELACIIGKEGSDIKAEEAFNHIFGFTILNDWTARDLQAQELKVGLGMAKGKDFATSIGPYIVTKDELEPYRIGDKYDLEMTARRNGKVMCQGNYKDVYYSFAQMIERASANVTLYPGDILASGTVGFGTVLEVGPDIHGWLKPGDEVEFEITGLGKLRNRVV